MESEWTAQFEDSRIRVINTWFNGELLYVNDELQDHRFGVFGSNLSGHVIDRNGERKLIKVSLGGSFSVKCHLFVDDKKVPTEKL